MSEPFLAEIVMFGGNFAPRGWALCDGQLLAISQNTALFSLLGTTYGGDGRTTFGLPDLRGRSPMHPGNGPGLTPRTLGEKGGTENVTLTTQQMPAHRHLLRPNNRNANSEDPIDRVLGNGPAGVPLYRDTPDPGGGTMDANFLDPTGGGQPHANVHPFQTVNFIIALVGVFPSRN